MEAEGENARYWRGRFWRDQVSLSFGLLAAAGIAAAVFARDLRFILIAGAFVCLPVWYVVESWLGLRDQGTTTPLDRVRSAAVFGLAFIASFLSGYSSRGWDQLTWDSAAFPLMVLAGLAVRGAYLWRHTREKPFGLLRANFSRLSFAGAQVHFASYGIAFAAAIGAATQFQDWEWRTAGYVVGALIGKLTADLVFTPPPPLGGDALSSTLMRLTSISPLWWGVPWGVLIIGYGVVTTPAHFPFVPVVVSELSRAAHIAVATVFVFGALSVIAWVREFVARLRGRSDGDPSRDYASEAKWVGVFWAAVASAALAYAVVFVPFWRSDEELFGVETWTCAKNRDDWVLGWVAKSGVRIHAYSEYGFIALSDLACVPRSNGRGCTEDKEGWDRYEFVVHGADGFDTRVAFERTSKAKNEFSMQNAFVNGERANELLWALYDRKSAELKVWAPQERLLYVKTIDLTRYGAALKSCVAHWRPAA